MPLRTIIKKIPFAHTLVKKANELHVQIRHHYFVRKHRHLVTGGGKFIRVDKRVNALLSAGDGARINLIGNIIFQSDLGDIGASHINIGKDATLTVYGDFVIGPNVNIFLSQGAELFLGGRKEFAASGITGATRVMVNRRVRIGTDCIIAWDVFITDCDWHCIEGRTPSSPTHIGDKVWIAHGCSILKGAKIGNGCVVAAHSVCSGRDYPASVLLAGAPAKVARKDICWSREMPVDTHKQNG